jgi:hypothetical protein
VIDCRRGGVSWLASYIPGGDDPPPPPNGAWARAADDLPPHDRRCGFRLPLSPFGVAGPGSPKDEAHRPPACAT